MQLTEPGVLGWMAIALDCKYRWRELPQVLFLSREKVCRDQHVFVGQSRSFVVTKVCLLRQNIYRDEHNFVSWKQVFYRDTNISRDESFVATKIFCRDQHNFVATNTCYQKLTPKMVLVAAPASNMQLPFVRLLDLTV